jgi:hypothetical protein
MKDSEFLAFSQPLPEIWNGNLERNFWQDTEFPAPSEISHTNHIKILLASHSIQ